MLPRHRLDVLVELDAHVSTLGPKICENIVGCMQARGNKLGKRSQASISSVLDLGNVALGFLGRESMTIWECEV